MKRIAVCIALCATVGCGSSSSQNKPPITPVTPAPVAPSAPMLAGTWTGMFDVTSCTGSVDWCQRTEPEPFLLNLDGNLYGVAEMEIWRRQPMSLDILQSNDVDGSTTLRGVSTIAGQSLDLEIRLEGSAPSSLNGSVRYTITGDPSEELLKSLTATRSGPILFIRPVTTVRAGALQGTWRGYVKRTACSGDCSGRDTSEATFWFSQQGAKLTGIFNWPNGVAPHDEIEGTASGQEFTFTRTISKPSCVAHFQDHAVCEDSIDIRGSVDSLGRMKGTIQQRRVGVDYYNGPFSWTATFELEGVVRQKGIQ